jgi:fructose-1,6-bisphosphatase/inositol monophosphatase family enzyme
MSPPPPALLDELLDVACVAAGAAATVLRSGFAAIRHEVSTKSSPTDMVTEMDRASEAEIARVLAARRPADGVLGEEGTTRAGATGIQWVVDPLDGTTNYLYRVPAYSVSIAAQLDGRTVVGVVVDPSRDETWSAVAGRGARCNEATISLSAMPRPLATALVATGFGYQPERRARQARVLTRVLPAVRDIRRFGSAAIDLCWVAGGRFDGFYEAGLQPWDLAAGALIALEAGAEVSDLAGGPPVAPSLVVAAAPGLLEPLRTLLIEAGAGPDG